MKKEFIITGDGSTTIKIPALQVHYHSIHGAIQESRHVFIEAGLRQVMIQSPPVIKIFEMALGTGLNAYLTAIESERTQMNVHYTTIEPFPVSPEEVARLNYTGTLGHESLFQKIHDCAWGKDVAISDHFSLRKDKIDLIAYSTEQRFNLVYYDAFAPGAQPELWTREVFEKLFTILEPRGNFSHILFKRRGKKSNDCCRLPGKKIARSTGQARNVAGNKIKLNSS